MNRSSCGVMILVTGNGHGNKAFYGSYSADNLWKHESNYSRHNYG